MASVGIDQLEGLIAASGLDEATKGTLTALVGQAKANPAITDQVVAQVKAALGM